MANKQRGYVNIELDKPRTLRYDLNALAELEDATGLDVGEIEKLAQSGKLGMKFIRAFLWAGLIHEDAELTIKGVGGMVDLDNMQEISEVLAQAFEGAISKNSKVSNGGK